MTDFLAHWYYGEGYPTYNGRFNEVGNQIVVELSQTTSTPSVTPFFKSALEIEIEFMDNTDTIIYVMHSLNGQAYVFDIDKEIYAVRVDPENWVLNQEGSFVFDASLEVTGIDKLNQFSTMANLYPNPSANQFMLDLTSEGAELQIIDQLGRLVLEENLKGKNHIINHELASGVYTVLLRNSLYEGTQQLLVP